MTPPLNLPAPGRRQSLYRVFATSQRPVFLVNSRLGLVCATPSDSGDRPPHRTRVPLLPKLRGHVAEFLNEGSLTRLRSPSASTCVGFGYGHPRLSLEGFSWCRRLSHFWPNGPDSLLGVAGCGISRTAHLPGSTCPTTHRLASVNTSPPSLYQTASGTGLFPGLPSPTPRGLGLVPRLTLGGSALPKEP
jgi:hypothetical protein